MLEISGCDIGGKRPVAALDAPVPGCEQQRVWSGLKIEGRAGRPIAIFFTIDARYDGRQILVGEQHDGVGLRRVGGIAQDVNIGDGFIIFRISATQCQ